MPEFKFSASRFKGGSEKVSLGNFGSPTTSDKASGLPIGTSELTRTPFYHILKQNCHFPPLNEGERILYSSIFASSQSVLVTNQRILIYSLESVELNPYTLHFDYQKNEFGILPQVRIIPNAADPSQLDFIIVDPVNCSVRYIEALKLVSSFDMLQNEHTLNLRLSHGEVITLSQYNEEVGLVVATNYRRVVCVSLKDQFGRTELSQSEILPSQFAFGFLRNRTYNIENYDQKNKIMALRFERQSSLITNLVVVEEQGLFTVVKFIKGTGHSVIFQQNLKELLLNGITNPTVLLSMTLKDVRLLRDSRYLLLGSNAKDGMSSLSLYSIKITEEGQAVLESSYQLKSVKTTDIYPKLFVFNDYRNSFILADHRLIFTDSGDFSETSTWEDFMTLRPELEIYGLSLTEGGDKWIDLVTSEGIFKVEMLSPGRKAGAQQFLKERIEQYLQFDTETSPVELGLSLSDYNFGQDDIESAVLAVSEEILNVKSSSLLPSYLVIGDNLKERFNLMKKLAKYISENLTLAEDHKMIVVNNAEKLGLSSCLYNYVIDNDLVTSIDSLLQASKYNSSLSQFFSEKNDQVVGLLQDYLTLSLSEDIGNETLMVKLASAVNDMLSTSYIEPERDVKCGLLGVQYDSSIKARPIFLDYMDLLVSINGIVRKLTLSYADQLDSVIDTEIKNSVSKAILGLSLFLYYSSNDMIQYTASQGTAEQSSVKQRLEKFYSANRENWIKIFILLKKQDEMIKLVRGFDDLESLGELLESEREFVETLAMDDSIDPIEIENMSADIEAKFDSYFDKYGYTFAETLFSHYVNAHKIDLLLTRFPKYSEYLKRFLESDTSYWRFSWILDVESENYSTAAKRLVEYTENAEDENIENKKLELNIAKLSLLASGDGKRLDDIESRLAVIEVQDTYEISLLSRFSLVDEKVAATLIGESKYLSSFDLLTRRVSSLLAGKFAKNVQLSLFELIDILTLLDFSSIGRDSFDDTFKLLSRLLRSNQLNSSLLLEGPYPQKLLLILTNLVFKRLILTDDWSKLKQGQDLEQSKFLKVLASLSEYKIAPPKSIDQLYISKDDLEYLSVDHVLYADYFKENDMLARLNDEVELKRWMEMQ
ncbi:DEKNAAC103306 [Brettanomyces naardenensis]|uniref:DEKNAAC103306 n=1 Tax=Brettanomyces naardenensis TaxID=13370 RepID=A0A448YMW6_BRENA|nr:DEKNAAC103306 [Brettanomyces naardenensis]